MLASIFVTKDIDKGHDPKEKDRLSSHGANESIFIKVTGNFMLFVVFDFGTVIR